MLEGKVTNFDKQEFFAGAGARYKLSHRLENEIKKHAAEILTFKLDIGIFRLPRVKQIYLFSYKS